MVLFFTLTPPAGVFGGGAVEDFSALSFPRAKKNVFSGIREDVYENRNSSYAGIIRIRSAGLRKSFLLSAGLPASTPFFMKLGILLPRNRKICQAAAA
jgi:hypothetical protein